MMQCAVCDASIDEFCVMCPYCGHVGSAPYASAPPLIAAHDLPIVYPDTGDDPSTFPFEQEPMRHTDLKRLLLFLIAAEMLIACIGVMTLPSVNASRKPPTSNGQASLHHIGVTFERIAVATKPDPTPLPTAPVIVVAPTVAGVPHARPHRVAPTRPPTRPTASPTLAPPPTNLPIATATLAPPSTMPMPTPLATPLPIATPTPTLTATPPPTIMPTPISTPSPVAPSPTPLTPEPTMTR